VAIVVEVGCPSDSSPIGLSKLLAPLVASAIRLEAVLNDGVSWYSSRSGTWDDQPVDV
jgi:hypothetical protein